MNKIILILILINNVANLNAQGLRIFDLQNFEKDSTHSFNFISLSEIYSISEDPDSLPIPDLSEKGIEEAPNFTYFQLDSTYRKRFLNATHLTEADKVFIYDYAINAINTFSVKNLKVIACLSIYATDWPYSPDDFMIGFEIDKKLLDGNDKYFTNSLVYIGKENPFVRGQVKPIIWEKIEPVDFPSKELPMYDTAYAGQCVTANVYKFEMEGLQYFVQDLLRLADNYLAVKRLLVIDKKTKASICEKFFYSGESESFAPIDNQWTGYLFKNKPPVIFGFQWVSFGCPSITFISQTEDTIYINCDNRH